MTNEKQIKFSLELTDTFGGEPNYAWVRRGEITLPEDATERQIVRAAKRAFGLTGLRARKESYGDLISLDFAPSGVCQILFITFSQD